jgi:hypothetical protein
VTKVLVIIAAIAFSLVVFLMGSSVLILLFPSISASLPL